MAKRKRKPPSDDQLGQLANDVDSLRKRLDNDYLTPTKRKKWNTEYRAIKERALNYLNVLEYPFGCPVSATIEEAADLRRNDERTELLTAICATLPKISDEQQRALLGQQVHQLRLVVGTTPPSVDSSTLGLTVYAITLAYHGDVNKAKKDAKKVSDSKTITAKLLGKSKRDGRRPLYESKELLRNVGKFLDWTKQHEERVETAIQEALEEPT